MHVVVDRKGVNSQHTGYSVGISCIDAVNQRGTWKKANIIILTGGLRAPTQEIAVQ